MQRELGKDIVNPQNRVAFLKDNCDKVIDEQLELIRELCPDIAQIEQ